MAFEIRFSGLEVDPSAGADFEAALRDAMNLRVRLLGLDAEVVVSGGDRWTMRVSADRDAGLEATQLLPQDVWLTHAASGLQKSAVDSSASDASGPETEQRAASDLARPLRLLDWGVLWHEDFATHLLEARARAALGEEVAGRLIPAGAPVLRAETPIQDGERVLISQTNRGQLKIEIPHVYLVGEEERSEPSGDSHFELAIIAENEVIHVQRVRSRAKQEALNAAFHLELDERDAYLLLCLLCHAGAASVHEL